MVEQLIWKSEVPGAHPIELYRYQTVVAGYNTIRFCLRYGTHELSDMSRDAVFAQLPGFQRHQLESSGVMG